MKQDIPLPQRLCNEIQLFDLCDLASCRYKDGRFCSNSDLLERFDKIADVEPRSLELYVGEELEDGDEFYDDGFEDCDCEDEGGLEEE